MGPIGHLHLQGRVQLARAVPFTHQAVQDYDNIGRSRSTLPPAEDVAHSPFIMMSTSSRRSSVGSGNEKPDPTKVEAKITPTRREPANEVHQAPANESRQQVKDQIELQEQQIRDRQSLEESGDVRANEDAHIIAGDDPHVQQPDDSIVQQRGQLRETIRIILQQIQNDVRDEDQGHDELNR